MLDKHPPVFTESTIGGNRGLTPVSGPQKISPKPCPGCVQNELQFAAVNLVPRL